MRHDDVVQAAGSLMSGRYHLVLVGGCDGCTCGRVLEPRASWTHSSIRGRVVGTERAARSRSAAYAERTCQESSDDCISCPDERAWSQHAAASDSADSNTPHGSGSWSLFGCEPSQLGSNYVINYQNGRAPHGLKWAPTLCVTLVVSLPIHVGFLAIVSG